MTDEFENRSHFVDISKAKYYNVNMQYNTKSKQAIIEFFKNKDEWYSAEQIANNLPSVGRSTVYRIINDFVASGYLVKEFSTKSNCYLYKVDNKGCREHFHLKCVGCGKFVHIHDKKTEEMLNVIAKNNDFCIDKSKTILYGKCEKCQLSEKE